MPREVVRRFQKGPFAGERTFLVYTEREAKALPEEAPGAFYVPWWEAKPGDWGRSDDGYVLQCTRRRHYQREKVVEAMVWFSVGRKWATFDRATGVRKGRAEFLVEPYFAKGVRPSNLVPRPWHADVAARQEVKLAVNLLVRLLVARKGRLRKEDWREVGQVGWPKDRIPMASALKWYRTESAKAMIADKLKALLDGEEITPEQTLRAYKDLLERSIEKGSFSVAKGILDKFAELTDLRADPVHRLPMRDEWDDDVDDDFAGLLGESEAEETEFEVLDD